MHVSVWVQECGVSWVSLTPHRGSNERTKETSVVLQLYKSEIGKASLMSELSLWLLDTQFLLPGLCLPVLMQLFLKHPMSSLPILSDLTFC